MLIKVFAVLLALFGLRRVVLRWRRGGALLLELIVWGLIWTGIGVVVFIPAKTDVLAHWLGVSTGFNALTFLTITGLLLAIYHLSGRVQALERDLTRLVRAQALAAPERIAPRSRAASDGEPPSAAAG